MNGPASEIRALHKLAPATIDRLERFLVLLRKWNRAINLVAPGTLDDAWQRHVADSVQVFDLLPADARLWLDLGSGGGFPGLVVAILALDQAPDLSVELVESDQRKCAFLQTVVKDLNLTNVTVIRGRVESLAPRRASVISARALAGLDRLLDYALPHLAEGGVCLFLKGAAFEVELVAARQQYRFDLQCFPSQTDPSGTLVVISNLSHV